MRLDGTNVVRHCKVLGSGVLILCTAWPGSVGARRVQPRPKVTVTVSKSGSGTGQVVSQPPGIDCGMDCIGEYPQDTELEITAQPSPDSTFDGWSGPCSGTEPCVVRVRAATQIEAKFSVGEYDIVVLSPKGIVGYLSDIARRTPWLASWSNKA